MGNINGKGMYNLTSIDIKSKPITLQHIVALYDVMKKHQDDVNAGKLLDLYEKMNKDQFIISFSGHFSAGKSSMINALLEEEILPKSPIPTSANIVEITNGSGNAKIHFYDEAPKEYQAPYDIEMIKEYCKDKNTVKKIELSTTKDIIPGDCIIVDTPGIDAADDADRVITESFLHVVDRLFYVMDYNHVQSDVNLHFLKQIQEKGIPFFIIINQVDKHNEAEIPFTSFDESVRLTFEQWNLEPEQIFYTSLFDQENIHNQYAIVKETIFNILENRKQVENTLEHAINGLLKDHNKFLKQSYDEKLATFATEEMDEEEANELREAKAKLLTIQNQPQQLEEEFQFDLSETLKNAYLMPASLREKASEFLESQQKDFKIGFFGAKKKTEAEQERRMNEFLEELQKNIETSIQWKLRDKIIALLSKYKVSSPQLMEFTKQFSITYTGEDLLSQIKRGAKFSGDYVLNYTNDVSAHIKGKFRTQAQHLWEEIQQEIHQAAEKEATQYEKQASKFEELAAVEAEKTKLADELDNKKEVAKSTLEEPHATDAAWELIEHDRKNNIQVSQVVQYVEKEKSAAKVLEKKEEPIISHSKSQHSIADVIESIENTIATVENVHGFQEIIEDLLDKKRRLDHRTLTIALFGAFSAGKSSFANALIGQSVLPSSPNPTTAVINRIAPVTEEHKHGTVVIQLKSEETLLQDLISITKDFSPESENLDTMVKWIRDKKMMEHASINKTYQSYLRAVLAGYDHNKNDIGNVKTITLEDFAEYVTDETKACYIELVTLYYDCSLTQLGITLVDTPGADSVNARHTNVAFDYIKYADAILYVTYYNHALNRADKDFLMQLGRIKESFELDKMFFIINASDLAADESELSLVKEYVQEQLLQLGIRFPRIYPVSSKRSLEEKQSREELNERMEIFETEFYQFINEDLPSLTMESALWDIKRAYEWMTNYIETVHLSTQEKETYQADLQEKNGLLIKEVETVNATMYEERIIQRIERQLHYVKERMGIRFHDMFKDKFNPTTINESGQKGMRQIEASLKELLDYTGYELLQEIRAVSLRIEAFIKELSKEVYEDLSKQLKTIDSKFSLPMMASEELVTPAYEQAFLNIDFSEFNKAMKRFKGPKAFFVENEKEIMKEDIYESLVPHIEDYISTNNQTMDQAYKEQWQQVIEERNTQVKKNIQNYIDNLLAITSETVDIDMLQEKQDQLAQIISEK